MVKKKEEVGGKRGREKLGEKIIATAVCCGEVWDEVDEREPTSGVVLGVSACGTQWCGKFTSRGWRAVVVSSLRAL